MSLVLDAVMTKFLVSNPLIRNSNTPGAYDETKAGTKAVIKLARDQYWMWWEGVDFETPRNNVVALATSPNGVDWTKSGELFGATEAWENGEVAPSCVLYDPVAANWRMYYHGGNNGNLRQIGLATSTDKVNWTKYGGNPIFTAGTSGQWDDGWVADLNVIRLAADNWIGWYHGTDAITSGNQRLGAVTSTDGITFTRYGSNPIISLGAGGSWESSHHICIAPFRDENGRYHAWYVGLNASAVGAIGYAWSDDGLTGWTKGANNPVISGTGTNTVDREAGDVVNVHKDDDKVCVLYTGENITDYPTNPPVRSICGAWVTLPVEALPARTARYFEANSRIVVPGAARLLGQSILTILVRYRMVPGSAYRELYTEEFEYNKEIFLRISNAGLMQMWFRTPTGIIEINATGARQDDHTWRWAMFVRRSASDAEVYDNGVSKGTSAVNAATDAGASAVTVGNWSTFNEAALCSIQRVITIQGTALTPAQGENAILNGALPGGVTAAVWYDLGGGSPEPDLSGNARDGTVTGTSVVAADQAPTAVLSGTALASITEADIVTGGKTIVVTLDNTIWIEP